MGKAAPRPPGRDTIDVMKSDEDRLRTDSSRRGVLRQRISTTFALVVALTALGTGLLLTLPRYFSERKMMETRARGFTSLVADSVINSADLYRTTGALILKDQMMRWMLQNPDIFRIEVVHVQGFKILVADHQGIRSYPDPAKAPEVSDPAVLEAIRSLELSAERTRGEGGIRLYRVVVPAMEEWGRRSYSMVAYFEYGKLYRHLIGSGVEILFLVLIAMGAAVAVAKALSHPIVADIEKLGNAVRSLEDGERYHELEIDSGDEVEELAHSINGMARNLKQSIGELEVAKRELELLDESKAAVVANISHELKTPLTAMAGYLELLEDGQLGVLSDEALHGISVCSRNLKRLQLRIDELVHLSRPQTEEVSQGDFEVIHLGAMLHSVVETLLPDLSAAEVYCSLNLATDLPSIRGNPERIERVFLNLLANAAKFTPPGGFIRVTAEPLVRDSHEGVLIRMADTGSGIPEQALTRVFDRFYQVDPSSSRKFGGMGLGLSLVKRIVADHGGRVWAESREQQGSVFFTWLPLARERSRSGTWRKLSDAELSAKLGEDPAE